LPHSFIVRIFVLLRLTLGLAAVLGIYILQR
jgi:hypothetical protein